MTEKQFDDRLKEIEQKYGAKREEADAGEDQEVSRLFEECGWTQEKIAGRMGKKQPWVSKRLCFGRFLKFIPTGNNFLATLTERTFGRHWSKTKGKESERFRQVADLIAGCSLPGNYANMLTKPGYAAVVKESLADGKWHKGEALLADLEAKFPGVTREQLHGVLTGLRRPQDGKRLERRTKVSGSQYRLAEVPATADKAQAAVAALREQAEPLLDELYALRRRHLGSITPGECERLAIQLRRLFEAACNEDTVNG